MATHEGARRTGRAARGAAALVALLVLVGLAAPALLAAAPRLPAGFSEAQAVSGVRQPTALAFDPRGALYVASQLGELRRWDGNPQGATSLALDLSGRVCTASEQGLLGVAVDPEFAQQRNVYLYYTASTGGGCVNRVSRFSAAADGTLSGERVLLDNILGSAGNHNGGDLKFAADKTLYVSVGDGGCDLRNPSRCQDDNGNARRLDLLNGKILRITRDGGIPRNNPYRGKGTSRCNRTGRAPGGRTCQEIWASGLRNPFRIAFNPAGKLLYINDVGGSAWEEIDRGKRGADYGWNVCEGRYEIDRRGRTCAKNNKTFARPVYAYRHGPGLGSITGGAFVPPSAGWPRAYSGQYLFADLFGGIYLLRRGKNGFARATLTPDAGQPISMTFGPGGRLYYTSFGAEGVRAIAFG